MRSLDADLRAMLNGDEIDAAIEDYDDYADAAYLAKQEFEFESAREEGLLLAHN